MPASVMIARVATGDLRSRIDAAYYAPEHLARERRLQKLGVPRPTIGEMSFLVTDGTHKTPTYVDEGVAFLSATNIDGGSVHFGDHKWISRSEFLQLKAWNCAPVPGDVLVAKSGSIGNAAVVMPNSSDFAVFESVAIVRCGRVDAPYLATFLNSHVGQQEIKRQTKGAVIRHLHLEDLRAVEVPEFNAAAQRYIGDKIRQAERLRERGRSAERRARASYSDAIHALGFRDEPRRKSYRATLRERLDPAYYDPSFTCVLDSDWLRENAEPLKHFVLDGSYGDLPDSATYGTGDKWLLRATDLDNCMTEWDAGVRVPAQEVGIKSLVRENDILLEVKGAIEKCAMGRGPAVGKHVNGTVFRLSPTGIHPGFLCLHLSAEIKRKYASREAVNNIIQYLNLDCIREMPVVRLGWSFEERIGDAFLSAVDDFAAAAGLTTAARLLVEHLIDGNLSEAELVAAQRALESGDSAPDRAVFRRLRCGEDLNAPALIPNLDSLYALLEDKSEVGGGG